MRLTVLIFLILSVSGCTEARRQQRYTVQQAQRPDYFPPFSWEKVPVMAHLGKNTAFSDEEIAFLTRNFSWIVLEKNHGAKTLGSTEPGILADARRIKAVKPDYKVLYYWNAAINFTGMYESVKEFDKHSRWALRDKRGNLVLAHANTRKRYDHGNPDLRAWWVRAAANEINRPEIDGAFIDALPQIAMHRKANIELLGQAKQDAWESGVMESIKELRRQTPGKLLLYNGLRGRRDLWEDMGARYLRYADAAMVEHFTSITAQEKEVIAANIEVIQQESEKGKIIVVKGFPEFTWLDEDMMKKPYRELEMLAREQIIFPLATFLIAAGENSYFCYSWGYKENHGTFSIYPEFNRPLGKPRGNAEQSGWVYTREFEHCRVTVDIEKRTASIEWADSE